MSSESNITYKQEILRKGIHLLSLSIPVTHIFMSEELLLTLLIPLTLFFLIVDILSHKVESIRKLLFKFFGKMLRPHEKEGKLFFNGATWVLLSAVLCILIFPKLVFIVSFTILIISDLSAALIGRKYGKTRFFDKSWEGTIAFIITASIIVVFYGYIFDLPSYYFIAGIKAAIVGGFVEALSKIFKIDDNLSIPLSIGGILLLANSLASDYSMEFINLIK